MYVFFDVFWIIGVFEPLFESNVSIVDELEDVLFDNLHPFATRCLHDRWDLVEFIFSDEMRDGRIADEDLFGELHPAPVGLLEESLREYSDERVCELETDLILLSGWECVDDTGDGLIGTAGMECGEDKVTRLGEFERHFDFFHVTHLSEEDNLWILTHRPDEGGVVIRDVSSDLFLFDDGLLVRMDVLDRVLDGDDMLGIILINLIDHRRECGGLTRSGRSGDEDETLSRLGDILVDEWETEILDRWNLLGEETEDDHVVIILE